MPIEVTNTISELAVHAPAAIRVFERLGIDYCCGGGRTLAAACQSLGLPPDEVLRSIEEAERDIEPASDWQKESLTALSEHIVSTHHVFTREELVRVERLLEKVNSRHSTNHPELIRLHELFIALKQELLPHMLKEEQILFPYFERMERTLRSGGELQPPFFATIVNPIRMMMKEHDTAGDRLREMRAVADNYAVPADGCLSFEALYQALTAFEADLHRHIHLENNLLFPRGLEMESRMKPEWQETSGAHQCFER